MYIGIACVLPVFVALSFVDSLPMLYVSIVLGNRSGFESWLSYADQPFDRAAVSERRSLAFGIFRSGRGSPVCSCRLSAVSSASGVGASRRSSRRVCCS
jgi:hypothetical protein